MVDFCLASARHPAGGFCFAVTADGRAWPTIGPSTDLRQWWVQLEAVRSLHLLASNASIEAAAQARYVEARDEQWAFVRDTLFDEQYGGIRELPRDPAYSPPNPLKSNCWKDCSHEVGTFLTLSTGRQGVTVSPRGNKSRKSFFWPFK